MHDSDEQCKQVRGGPFRVQAQELAARPGYSPPPRPVRAILTRPTGSNSGTGEGGRMLTLSVIGVEDGVIIA